MANERYAVMHSFSGEGLVDPEFEVGDGFDKGAIFLLDADNQTDILKAWIGSGFLSKIPVIAGHNRSR